MFELERPRIVEHGLHLLHETGFASEDDEYRVIVPAQNYDFPRGEQSLFFPAHATHL